MVIWLLSIRLIHWALAFGVLANQFFLEAGDPPHIYVGYVALVLVILRFYLGLQKRNLAYSFRNFPLAKKDVKTFVFVQMGKSKEPPYRGHNPLASYIYLFIWALVGLLALSGWLMTLDTFWGNETLEEIHEVFANLLIALVVVHLLGIALDSFKHKRKTWLGMVNGRSKEDL